MQCNDIKAFRQRLVRAGFTDVCIYDLYNGLYKVYCTSSDGKLIIRELSILQMRSIPRVVWFD